MANKHDSPTVSHGKVSAATPNPSILAHPLANIFVRFSPKKTAVMIATKLAMATKRVPTVVPLHALLLIQLTAMKF
ncbi:hypothetical protein C355_06729 [Cryptococcus neoformans Th84]|nr:hypothetical protein C355_06729 [Cryptococcus neoformans var. grubii Th84]OXH42892.1 hypothetical protein J003_06702 [Cryptococcus neoformans var. grubii]OXH62580.1 hypothetical protein J001_06702 [Cryptococcus neoformans var. grubii]